MCQRSQAIWVEQSAEWSLQLQGTDKSGWRMGRKVVHPWKENSEQRNGPPKSRSQKLSQAGTCGRGLSSLLSPMETWWCQYDCGFRGLAEQEGDITAQGTQWAQTPGRPLHSPQWHMEQQTWPRGPWGLSCFCCGSINILCLYPSANVESSLDTMERDRRKEYWCNWCTVPRKY